MTDLEPRLESAIRDRVAHEHPDLDRLVAGSVRAGTRLRWRRRSGVVLAAATGVAAVAAVAAVSGQLGDGAGTSPGRGNVGVAAKPTSTPTAPALQVAVPGESVQAPNGADVHFRGPSRSWREWKAGGGPAGQEPPVNALVGLRNLHVGRGPALTADELVAAAETWLRATYSNVGSVENAEPQAGDTGAREVAPFTVTAPGWTCSEPGDEKFDCTNGGRSVHLVWRDASSHDAYAAGTVDKGGDWVSDVHGGVFVTIDGPGALEVGQSITWIPHAR